MRCVLALSVAVLAALLAACGKQPADNLTDALAVDPVRLKALRAQCAADGRALYEHQTLSDLPSIPPSFKEPADGVAPAFPAEPEGTP